MFSQPQKRISTDLKMLPCFSPSLVYYQCQSTSPDVNRAFARAVYHLSAGFSHFFCNFLSPDTQDPIC